MTTTAQLQAAVYLLRQPIQDRPRAVHTDPAGLMLIDDSGGEPIESFDDVTACHYFLVWLDRQRQARETCRQIAFKRSCIKLVKGA